MSNISFDPRGSKKGKLYYFLSSAGWVWRILVVDHWHTQQQRPEGSFPAARTGHELKTNEFLLELINYKVKTLLDVLLTSKSTESSFKALQLSDLRIFIPYAH